MYQVLVHLLQFLILRTLGFVLLSHFLELPQDGLSLFVETEVCAFEDSVLFFEGKGGLAGAMPMLLHVGVAV